MKSLRRWMAAGFVVLLVGCGGSAPEGAPVVAARAGSAEIGAAGGKVDAVLEGGTTVTLDVPAGAVSRSTLFRIDPQGTAAAGELGAFALTTDAEALLRPVALTVVVADAATIGPNAGLVLQTASGSVALGRPVDVGRRITAELSLLPPTAEGTAARLSASREHPLATGAPRRSYLIRLLEAVGGLQRISDMTNAILRLEQQGSIENAILAQLSVEAAGQPVASFSSNGRSLADIWQGVVCPQQSFSVSALNTYNGVDVLTFRRLALDALGWTLLARSMNASLSPEGVALSCGNLPPDFRQAVRDRLPTYIGLLRQSLNQLNARTDYVQLLDDRFPELVQLEVFMQTFDLGRSVLTLIEEQMNRLRPAGFAACREAGDQDLQRRLLTAKVGNPAYTGYIPYGEADLRQDIEFCGIPLRWQLLNDQRQVVDSGSIGGVAFGDIRSRLVVGAVGTRYLVLRGPVRALMCSRADTNGGAIRFANNEQLVARAGPDNGAGTEVGRLTPSNQQNYLEASPLEFDVEVLRNAAAAIQPSSAIRLQLQRSGDFCGGTLPNLTSHAVLVDLTLDFAGIRITTAALPDAEMGVPYLAALAARGGSAPYTWSATGLPAGLSLDAGAGTIQGTPAIAGSFAVSLEVRSADGQTASSTAAVLVHGASSGIQGVDHNVNVEIVLPSGPVNCPATRLEDFGAKATFNGSISCAGQSGESASASLSFTKSFAGNDLVGVAASGIASVSKAGEFGKPGSLSHFTLRFTATRTTQLAIDTSFTLPTANADFRLNLGRDGSSVFDSDYVSPIRQTLTLLPGKYQLIVYATVSSPVDPTASAGFDMQLAFGP